MDRALLGIALVIAGIAGTLIGWTSLIVWLLVSL
jgi:hypothetical protein